MLRQRDSVRGEFTIVLGRGDEVEEEHGSIEEAVEELIRNGIGRMDALKQVARRRGLSKRDVYKRMVGEPVAKPDDDAQ